MTFHFLIILGVAVLSVALRSFRNTFLFRLGTLGILATSFLIGWLLGGSIGLGVALAASWLFLPWLEILTRIRQLRLPIDRKLESRMPPSRSTFPNFSEMTDEIEEAGFEYLRDMGWDHEHTRTFYRVFNDGTRHTQASICMSEQGDIAFYYLSITSRTTDGRIFTTWNYPFSYGLKLQPNVLVQRFASAGPFETMLEAHEIFLLSHDVTHEQLLNQDADIIAATMQDEMRAQITHNIDVGFLRKEGSDKIRYTPRGMFFLWFEFLRDLVRIS